ncbi:MAG: glycerol kinase [Microbacteriaceae bacterium]|nr:glycerol kinase [Microbacteriaceae bacterium]
MTDYVLAIDNGTTSTRAIVFDHLGNKVGVGQKETTQIFPNAGWVEHDPEEIWSNTRDVMALALTQAGLSAANIVAVGITNQRETTVVWDRETGKPLYNAIVWQDTRTSDIVSNVAQHHDVTRITALTGLPVSTYFAASKLRWILDNIPDARARARSGSLLFGTIDTWLLWNLTGGPHGGVHATDVTNASRTLLMNLETLDWDDELLAVFDIPRNLLPVIRPSSGLFGVCVGDLEGVPVSGILGDQHAATFGQCAFEPGEAKNTYGTGNFLMLNTGIRPTVSQNGLITTVAYQVSGEPAHYALEGSIAVTGSLIQWLRDNLQLFSSASDVEPLAASVSDNGGIAIVPAFSGLFAPHWDSNARGVIVGLTRYVTKAHIARAALESVAFQTAEVLAAMNADTGVPLTELKVDGGMVVNNLLMQFQSDIVRVPVVRPRIIETTALGAAFAAGLAVGYWSSRDELRKLWQEDSRWIPQMQVAESERLMRVWSKAVSKSAGWVDDDSPST